MGIDQYAKSLILPGGEVHPLRERDVHQLTPHQLQMLSWLHEWAHNFQLTIVCKRCDHAITGKNNDSPDAKFFSVECLCQQWRFDRR